MIFETRRIKNPRFHIHSGRFIPLPLPLSIPGGLRLSFFFIGVHAGAGA